MLSKASGPPKFHTLKREQLLSRPIEEVFAFFSEAGNLAELTPPWLGFRILTPQPIRIARGVEIEYLLSWHGFPMRWTTQIRRWAPPHCFADTQLKGPYALWHHTHRFEACNGRTRMSDVVRYRLPLGILGRTVHSLKVRRDVESIFDYRFQRIQELLAGPGRAEGNGQG